jgi:hypothetical protein
MIDRRVPKYSFAYTRPGFFCRGLFYEEGGWTEAVIDRFDGNPTNHGKWPSFNAAHEEIERVLDEELSGDDLRQWRAPGAIFIVTEEDYHGSGKFCIVRCLGGKSEDTGLRFPSQGAAWEAVNEPATNFARE